MGVTGRAAAMNWSGGRDSALALSAARADPGLDVRRLVTTVRSDNDRVTMHGVRRELVAAQADRLGLPLEIVEIPPKAGNPVYEERMAELWERPSMAPIEVAVFGDIHLADVRAYREELLGEVGIDGAWPLWGRDPAGSARRFVTDGGRAVLVCIDRRRLDPSFLGRVFDEELLADLPDDVDPSGEEGAFHTFVVEGPGFSGPVPVERGRVVERDGFAWQDLRAPC